MAEQQGIYKIRALQQSKVMYQVGADILFAAASALLIGSIVHFVFEASVLWGVFVFIIGFSILCLWHKPWRVSTHHIVSYLNQSYPELEESAGLVTKPGDDLNLLEKLQLTKVNSAFQQIPSTPGPFIKPLKFAGIAVLCALALSVIIAQSSFKLKADIARSIPSIAHTAVNGKPEVVLPQISGLTLTILPPAYTGKIKREQDKFTIDAEEGSTVNWKIKTNIAVKQVSLVFNEHEYLKLQNQENGKQWTTSKQLNRQGYYQVAIDGKLSDIYSIQIIKDEAPVIRIKTPKQYTYIDAGEAPKVTINTSVNDDYGISNAMINATVAKGSGEAVKFKEYKIPFPTSFSGRNKEYNLQKLIDLPSLNMEPGDELYFYVLAQDNHQQQSRTDVYIVSIQDTAKLLSMDGLVSAANIKPEFFRSERQIILDSEKLLKEKDSISVEKFNQRSNDLAADQKLLRLRYGKFLGEEDESQIGEAENSELGKAENFGNDKMIMDAYTDKHDNAEDATFLDPAEKAQLHATLTEMWKAELHLRMYKPQDALPFEYKALRLLKDLQQKSRSYVAKTGYNPPPLKLEKRLTGDLTKIAQPEAHLDIKATADQYENLKNAIPVLDQLYAGVPLNNYSRRILELTGQQFSARAAAKPAVYLPAINALHRILASRYSKKEVAEVEKAVQQTLPPEKFMPHSASSTADMGLAQGYYKKLNR